MERSGEAEDVGLKDRIEERIYDQARKSPAARLIDVECDMTGIVRRLTSGLNGVIASEPEVTNYDEIVSDGDCGTTLKRGAEGKMTKYVKWVHVMLKECPQLFSRFWRKSRLKMSYPSSPW